MRENSCPLRESCRPGCRWLVQGRCAVTVLAEAALASPSVGLAVPAAKPETVAAEVAAPAGIPVPVKVPWIKRIFGGGN